MAATSSSDYTPDSGASKAIDGNLNTLFHSNLEAAPYLKVTFSQEYCIKRITVMLDHDNPNRYFIGKVSNLIKFTNYH